MNNGLSIVFVLIGMLLMAFGVAAWQSLQAIILLMAGIAITIVGMRGMSSGGRFVNR